MVLWFEETAIDGSDHVLVIEFLDIRDRVSNRGSEEGLLGLAIDPHKDGQFYVYYSAANPRRSVVSRFSSGSKGQPAERKPADPGSELVILEVDQPYPNHNGGQIAFGPDGYLYVGLGDGGSAGDPLGNGQNTSTLLGSILRIDVSECHCSGQPYAIPPDNPFADGGGRSEIWAYGLRNPWRFSFDRQTGDLWTGDVGQNQWEEIDIIERGGNYGWNILEANHCFNPRNNCDDAGTIPPVWEYSLDGTPCSVIGGHVYRGNAIPWLRGTYIYGDFCSGKSTPSATKTAKSPTTKNWPTPACASCPSPKTTTGSCTCCRSGRAFTDLLKSPSYTYSLRYLERFFREKLMT